MPNTIFFSWQSDTATGTGRNLVERALERAASRIGDDTEIEEAVRELAVDRDTKDVPGSPPIVETIFLKIDKATVFIPDLTFTGSRLQGRPTPNPNVLIEYGWALKSLGHSRILPVMNTAFGSPTAETMPFNLQHLRYPITYHCPPDASEETRRKAREDLGRELERALRRILLSIGPDTDDPGSPAPFVPHPSEDGVARFRSPGQALGVNDRQLEVRLNNDPAVWIRVMPQADPGRTWLVTDLRKLITASSSIILPITSIWNAYSWVRDQDGFGVYASTDTKRESAEAAVYVFTTGEIWSIDTTLLKGMTHEGRKFIPDVEEFFSQALRSYSECLTKLGLPPPHDWAAGMEDLNGRALYSPTMQFPRGRYALCRKNIVAAEGAYIGGMSPKQSIEPFFVKLFDACGVARPLRP